MKQLMILDNDYLQWIKELSSRYRKSQIKAAVKVNEEMLRFYWELGKDISERQYDNKYGSHFYEKLSHDLYAELGIKKGLAPTSLKYTKYFYQLYSTFFKNRQQLADDLESVKRSQVVEDSLNENVQPIAENPQRTNYRQLADDLEILFSIPWAHHQ